MISDKTREFIDDIDEVTVKAELVHVVNTLDAIKAGATENPREEEFARAFDASVEGYHRAISNQHTSISRLLEERREHLREMQQLKQENATLRAEKYDRERVGPE